MSSEQKVNVVIRSASLNDIPQLQALYKQQYSLKIQQEHKSIAKYVKKAFKTDLKDIDKYYLSLDRHELFVAVNGANSNEIIGMIGIRENKSFKFNKAKKDQNEMKQMEMSDDRKPDFEYAYKCIDDVIDIFNSINNDKAKQYCKEAEIMRFGVAKNYRRKGIGNALFNHVKKNCISHGYQRIVASTMNVLEDAIKFYESTGFQLLETESCGFDTKLEFLRFVYKLV